MSNLTYREIFKPSKCPYLFNKLFVKNYKHRRLFQNTFNKGAIKNIKNYFKIQNI